MEDASILEKLVKFGVTQEKLTAGKQLISETKLAVQNQKKEKGEAQQATLSRDKAVDVLNEWLSDFIAIEIRSGAAADAVKTAFARGVGIVIVAGEIVGEEEVSRASRRVALT